MFDLPILKCFPSSETHIKAWCPFCNEWHTHGYNYDIKEITTGTQIAHCLNSESPFKKTGYRLKLMTKAERKAIGNSVNL